MGCSSSQQRIVVYKDQAGGYGTVVRKNSNGSIFKEQGLTSWRRGGDGNKNHHPGGISVSSSHSHTHNENVQDEARSFRSKVSAIKMLAKQPSSYESFLGYLHEIGKAEYLICFRDLEEIKKLSEDQVISRTYALVCRYKAIYEEFKINLVTSNTPSSQMKLSRSSYSTAATVSHAGTSSSTTTTSFKHIVWECFGKLKSLDYNATTVDILQRYITITENDIISRLVLPFETYLTSSYYKSWQEEQIEQEKQRNNRNRSRTSSMSTAAPPTVTNNNNNNNAGALSPRSSMVGGLSPMNSAVLSTTGISLHSSISSSVATTHQSGQFQPYLPSKTLLPSSTSENYANAYPDILIVDDSNITLKITGKTLEQDGHHVEKATNGQIALNLMKNRTYDVVLIDCNMPVMDGFEAVRFFREFEKEQNDLLTMNDLPHIPSDVSSMSDSQDDHDHDDHKEKRKHHLHPQQQQQPAEEKRSKYPVVMNLYSSLTKQQQQPQQPNGSQKSKKGKKTITSQQAPIGEEDHFMDPSLLPTTDIDDSNKEQQEEAEEEQKRRQQLDNGNITEATAASCNCEIISNKLKRVMTVSHAYHHQLIIGMSTNIDEETRKRALNAGMDYFLPKPFTLQKFIDTIRLSREQRKQVSGGGMLINEHLTKQQQGGGGDGSRRNSDGSQNQNLKLSLSPSTAITTVLETNRDNKSEKTATARINI
jgi:CheY-like chemotaxis protein